MLTMYKTIEPPVGRLHRLYWTLPAILQTPCKTSTDGQIIEQKIVYLPK